ncbi:hypothetical protein PENTCL1PPCAC_14135, partial [Pristionchus entomophagus]
LTSSHPSMELPESECIVHEFPKEFFNTPNRWEELFTIVVEDREFKAHTELLKARVPFFNGLLSSNMVEAALGRTHLHDMDAATLSSLLDYVYTGTLTVTETNVQNLLMGAVFLQIESVKDECAIFMGRRIRIDSVIDLLKISSQIADEKMKKTVIRFIDVKLEEFRRYLSDSQLSGVDRRGARDNTETRFSTHPQRRAGVRSPRSMDAQES